MGAWSAGSFGNDDALDFVGALQDEKQIFDHINDLSQNTAYMEADEAAKAIAACDVIAGMMDRAAADMPEIEVIAGFDASSLDPKIYKSAAKIVEQVRANSELAELWGEDDPSEWYAALDDLLVRLDPSKPYTAPEIPEEEMGDIGWHCALCDGSVDESDLATLVIEMDIATITNYTHRSCVEKQFKPPYWNADGSPSTEVIAQFKKMVGL